MNRSGEPLRHPKPSAVQKISAPSKNASPPKSGVKLRHSLEKSAVLITDQKPFTAKNAKDSRRRAKSK
jgi:hypothetical protein